METCDQCDASFTTEEDYVVHLREAHGRETEIISQESGEKWMKEKMHGSFALLIFGAVLLLTIGLAIYVAMVMGPGSESTAELPSHGNDSIISQVETEQASDIKHVAKETEINYSTVPPTGGRHYSSTVSAGFYPEPHPFGDLVHSLEHGAVVVYYDPAELTTATEEDLKKYAKSHRGHWQSFIAVPNPKDDPNSAYVLTAWEKRLTLDEYDSDVVRAFVAEYIGRGPENPVR